MGGKRKITPDQAREVLACEEDEKFVQAEVAEFKRALDGPRIKQRMEAAKAILFPAKPRGPRTKTEAPAAAGSKK